jgi:hemerythrin-like metal-binding protein
MRGTFGPQHELGVPEIDGQHRDIIATALDLVAALSISGEASVAPTLEVLSRYVLVHFEAEERWMRRAGYPRYGEHVARHDQLVARVVAMTRDHAQAGASAVLALRLRNAVAWLEDHIDEDDRKLARFAAERAAAVHAPPLGA